MSEIIEKYAAMATEEYVRWLAAGNSTGTLSEHAVAGLRKHFADVLNDYASSLSPAPPAHVVVTDSMVEAAARAMCIAWHYAPIGTPDGDAEWRKKQDQYRKQARAALSAVIVSAPDVEAYRLLSEGEIVQRGDQPLNDDCVSWGDLVGWEAGIAYSHSVFVPIRRALSAEVEG